ncbi:MAG: putative RDD family membrane protein YckC [Cognaticolwellia sp.]|jgi:uncharacterized RDD family membrane protein YckC
MSQHTTTADDLVGLPSPDLLKRFVAFLLDALLLAAVSWVVDLSFAILTDLPGWSSTVVYLLLSTVYFGLLESSSYQASLGKRAMGLLVIGHDGRRLKADQAMLRGFSRTVLIYFLIPILLLLFNRRGLGLWDFVAKSRVVQLREPQW